MNKFYSALLAGALSLALLPANANNLRVTGVTVPPNFNTTALNGRISCNVAWDHSWRDSVNWDAAWVFVKYRVPGSNWRTATLSSYGIDHPASAGVAVSGALDGKGIFVYRAQPGAGTFNAGLQLTWNFSADFRNNSPGPGTPVEIRVFAVEMVRIPQMAFNLNTGPLTTNANEFQQVGSSLARITSEGALPVGALRWQDETGGGGSGNVTTLNGVDYAGSDALSASYPKGYAASYCMKYETTQGQYTDFLNSLTRAQQIRRVAADISGDAPRDNNIYVMMPSPNAVSAGRNTITCPANGMGTTAPVTFSCSRPDRTANSLIWADGAAYLDWAGLRPMTELEFEKICRGPLAVAPGEHAWGAEPAVAATAISTTEDGTETAAPATANAVFDNITFTGGDGGQGPLRAGVFATATSNRAQAGASYYGVMEMSGNCWERCITVAGFDTGQPTNAGLFDGLSNGDGLLDSLGNHNALTWPNATDVRGSNFRGGNWSRPTAWAMTADRIFGGSAISGRTTHRSIRGVRSQASLSDPAQGTNGTTLATTKFQGGAYDGYDAPASVTGTFVVAGVSAERALPALTIFPNPATGAVRIRLTASAPLRDGTLTLTDALGRPVRTLGHLHGPADLTLDRAGLAAGLYSLRLTDGGTAVGAGRVCFRE